MEVKIKDVSFMHTEYSTLQKSKYITWTRINKVCNVCFFTDNSMVHVDSSNDMIKVAWLLEPRAVNQLAYNYIDKNSHKFNYILTYDSELLASGDKYLFYPHGGCWLNDEDKKIFEKSKKYSIIASNKSDTYGHKLRHDVIRTFFDTLDVFGSGYKYIDNKIIGLRDYKFSIVIENSKQDTYFTEKLIDTLLTGTIPLYWGTDKINEYFTNIPTFNTIEELGDLMRYYDENEYPIADIKDNFDRAMKYTIPEDYIYENYKFIFK